MYVAFRGTDRLPAQIVRFVLTAVLCLFLYNGSKTVKWISVALFLLGGAFALPNVFSDSPLAVALGGIMAMIYLSFAGFLIGSSRVNAFLELQRREIALEQKPLQNRWPQDEDE